MTEPDVSELVQEHIHLVSHNLNEHNNCQTIHPITLSTSSSEPGNQKLFTALDAFDHTDAVQFNKDAILIYNVMTTLDEISSLVTSMAPGSDSILDTIYEILDWLADQVSKDLEQVMEICLIDSLESIYHTSYQIVAIKNRSKLQIFQIFPPRAPIKREKCHLSITVNPT